MTIYSTEYLEGIKDARFTLKEGGKDRLQELAASELAFIDRVSKCAGSSLGADYLRGVKDFWEHQLKLRGQK